MRVPADHLLVSSVNGGGVFLLGPDGVVKAKALSGRDNLLFIRDGQSGQVVARTRQTKWGELNEELHTN